MPIGTRSARIALTADPKSLDKGLNEGSKRLRRFARDTERGTFGKSLARIGKGALEKVGHNVTGFGTSLLTDTIGDVYNFEKSLTSFGIAGDLSTEKLAAMRSELARVSKGTGIARGDLLNGASAYAALTGDADGAAKSVATFARVSLATGASMADISATAAAMRDNLKIDPKDFEAAFSALHVQGKAGAIELRELSNLLAGIAPQFSQFAGGTGAGGLAEMGSAMQVLRKGFGTSSEAATGLRATMTALVRNADKFGKAGVKVFTKNPKTGKKELGSFLSIVDQIGNSKLAKDPTLLAKAFGSDEAYRSFLLLSQNRGLLDELTAKSKDKAAIDRDANRRLESSTKRIQMLWNSTKEAIADALTPERIKAFVDGMVEAAKIIGLLGKHLGKRVDELTDYGKHLGGKAFALLNPEEAARQARADKLGDENVTTIKMRSQELKSIRANRDAGINTFMQEVGAAAFEDRGTQQAGQQALAERGLAELGVAISGLTNIMRRFGAGDRSGELVLKAGADTIATLNNQAQINRRGAQ